MPRFIRITALLLCAVMLVGLVGCGQKTPEPTQPVTAPSTEPTQPSTEPEPQTEETEPVTEPVTEPEPEPFDLSEVQPIIEDGRYVYNPCVLSRDAMRFYDEGFPAFYKDFITALLNYETECPCAEEDYARVITMVAGYECPFFHDQDLELNWAADFDYFEKKLSWSYYVDRETLQERIDKTAEAVQAFLDLVSPEDAEEVKMQTVYHAFCPLMTYDYDSVVSRERIDSYYAFLEHTGICVTFADALAQILAQVDIDATIVNGPAGDEPHAWDYASINGQNYFFDPTFEVGSNGGTGYVYYGMTLEEREASGPDRVTMGIGRYTTLEPITAETHLYPVE